MSRPLRVLVLLGSVRRGRLSDRVAAFVMARLARLDGVTGSLADLAAIDLPVMEERLRRVDPAPPGLVELGEAIAAADAVVVESPEYNHGYPGALKNALDYSCRSSSGRRWRLSPCWRAGTAACTPGPSS